MNPVDKLIEGVLEAIRTYDATGDHNHAGGPFPGDCIRCALVNALPPFARRRASADFMQASVSRARRAAGR